jgi:hypothetical protein
MRFSPKQAGAMLVMAVCATAANADDKMFEFSGFGTVGAAWADTNKADFVRDGQPTGIDSTGGIGLDSLLGVQGTVHLTPQISGTAQVMFRRFTTKNYELAVPLAFVKDQLTSDLAVRIGKLPLPLFMISDYRQVGYANPFIRPPQEVYGAAPVDSHEGIDALYSHSFGPVDVSAQAYFGRFDLDLGGASVTDKKVTGGNISATYGPMTLRYGRMISNCTLVTAADPLVTTIGQLGFTSLAGWLSTHDRSCAFSGYGAVFDWKNILVQGEMAQANTGGFPADFRGRYLLAGYRIQKFTPYAIYSSRHVISEKTDSTIPAVGPLAPLAAAVNALIAAPEQHSYAAGVRWDFHESMDLKVQVDRVFPDASGGLFANIQPGFKGPVTVASAAIDFVF